MPGYWVRRLDEIPLVPTDDPEDFDWRPIQHHFGLSAAPGTLVLVVGGAPGSFATTWRPQHFERVPVAD